ETCLLHPAMTKNLFPFPTMRTYVVAHVLNHTKDRYIDLAKHGNTTLHIEKGNILWSADDHPAAQRNFLSQRQGRIAGTRRQVHDEVIKFIPQNIPEKLPHDTHDNRTAPNDRGLIIKKESHRN